MPGAARLEEGRWRQNSTCLTDWQVQGLEDQLGYEKIYVPPAFVDPPPGEAPGP